MSQTFKPSKIRIYSKSPGTVSTGANTNIDVDGKPLGGVTFLKLEIKPGKVAKLTLEMCVDVEDIELDNDLRLVGQKPDVKFVRTISKFESSPV